MDNNQIWKDTLDSLQVSVSDATYKTYLAHTHLHDLKETSDRAIAEIGCNSFFIKNLVEKRYFGIIQDTLSQVLDKPVDITFIVKSQTRNPSPETDKLSPLFDQPKIDREQFHLAVKRANLRTGFTFDKYAVSSTNQMAHAAALAVSQSPGESYNPLFIYGGVGVGKTHLMHSVGYAVLEKNLDAKVVACTAEDFTNDIVEGIKHKTTPEVRKKYRKLDALLIDDIQFIAGKNTAQEEFFHTFNAVTNAGGQIIMTADKPPKEIDNLEDRLRSRFEAGLAVDVGKPDFELRCAIISIKAEERDLKMDPEMVQMVAGNIDSARGIQGFLTKLFSEVNFKKEEMTLELIQNLLGKTQEIENGHLLKSNPTDVVGAVSKYFSIGKRDLLGPSRKRPLARPRQILMHILRKELDLPLQEVGRIVGGRDHTTVMHAVNTITNLATDNGDIREDIRGIKKML